MERKTNRGDWRRGCADVTQMSTPASIRNPAKITSSNICSGRGFSCMCQFSPSCSLSVSDLTSRQTVRSRRPVSCSVSTPRGAKKSICADKRLATALPVCSHPRHVQREGGRGKSEPNEKVTPCTCSVGSLTRPLLCCFVRRCLICGRGRSLEAWGHSKGSGLLQPHSTRGVCCGVMTQTPAFIIPRPSLVPLLRVADHFHPVRCRTILGARAQNSELP